MPTQASYRSLVRQPSRERSFVLWPHPIFEVSCRLLRLQCTYYRATKQLTGYDLIKHRFNSLHPVMISDPHNIPRWGSNAFIYSSCPSEISNRRIRPSSQPAASRVPFLLTAKHQIAPPLQSTDRCVCCCNKYSILVLQPPPHSCNLP